MQGTFQAFFFGVVGENPWFSWCQSTISGEVQVGQIGGHTVSIFSRLCVLSNSWLYRSVHVTEVERNIDGRRPSCDLTPHSCFQTLPTSVLLFLDVQSSDLEVSRQSPLNLKIVLPLLLFFFPVLSLFPAPPLPARTINIFSAFSPNRLCPSHPGQGVGMMWEVVSYFFSSTMSLLNFQM